MGSWVIEAGDEEQRGAAAPQGSETVRDGKIVDGKIQLSTRLADTHLEMPPRQDAEKVDDRDADTPDAWVKRHKDM